MELLYAFAKRIDQVPLVLKKESPGYVYNAISGKINDAAFGLLNNGIASIEDIDRAFMTVYKTKAGPFGMMDLVGLDTIWHVARSNASINKDAGALAFADHFKKEYIDKGWLGEKAGRGFYTYPNPAYAQPGFLMGEPATGTS